jgi:hypothetical protein
MYKQIVNRAAYLNIAAQGEWKMHTLAHMMEYMSTQPKPEAARGPNPSVGEGGRIPA